MNNYLALICHIVLCSHITLGHVYLEVFSVQFRNNFLRLSRMFMLRHQAITFNNNNYTRFCLLSQSFIQSLIGIKDSLYFSEYSLCGTKLMKVVVI